MNFLFSIFIPVVVSSFSKKETSSRLFRRKLFAIINISKSQHSWGSKKNHRKVKVSFPLDTMADTQVEKVLAPLRASVKQQV